MSKLFELPIASQIRPYKVLIQQNIAKYRFSSIGDIAIIDKKLLEHYGWLGGKANIYIEATETEKNLYSVPKIIEQLKEKNITRNAKLIAVGGGIIQDLVTFSASCYMRGIDWIYFPTTLLGMVDSCIGGKSSLNVGNFKNLVGNFYPPSLIFIDPEFCKSLSQQQKIDGICEAAKICYAAGKEPFEEYLQLTNSSKFLDDVSVLENIIKLSLSCKKKIIELDEFDQNIRLNLNFGHTFGHALEVGSAYQISHGVGVGLGMLSAIQFSSLQHPEKSTTRLVEQLKSHLLKTLKMVPQVKNLIATLSLNATMKSFEGDKKHTEDNYTLILANDTGLLEKISISRTPETKAGILLAYQMMIQEISNEI